ILRDPEPVPGADLIISESTYGGRAHAAVRGAAGRLGGGGGRRGGGPGQGVIPAVRGGRPPAGPEFLHRLVEARRLPSVPIFVDSPMSLRATEVFRSHTDCYDDEARALLLRHPDLFGEGFVRYVEKVHESVELNRREGPCVIISASGMCEAGRV